LLLGLWCWAFLGQRVHWGQTSFHLAEDGSVAPLATSLENE